MRHRAVDGQAFPDSPARLCATLAEDPTLDPAILTALAALDWAMLLPSVAAPGFFYLAGAWRGTAVGGGGRNLAEAAGRLAGEVSESIALETSPVPCTLPADSALVARWGDGPRTEGVSLVTGHRVGVPVAALMGKSTGAPASPPRSLGLGAGVDAGAARAAGLLELVERDAAAVWWNDGARPRAISAGDAASATAELADMRKSVAGRPRPTTFMALPSFGGVPVVVAMSRDPVRGGLAFGLKAAFDIVAAVSGAMCELLQMEIALEIAVLRAARDQSTRDDVGVLRRAALDPDAFDAFAARMPAASEDPPPGDLAALVARLAGAGVEAIACDLRSPEGGLAVAKVFASGLRPFPDPAARPAFSAPGAFADLMG